MFLDHLKETQPQLDDSRLDLLNTLEIFRGGEYYSADISPCWPKNQLNLCQNSIRQTISVCIVFVEFRSLLVCLARSDCWVLTLSGFDLRLRRRFKMAPPFPQNVSFHLTEHVNLQVNQSNSKLIWFRSSARQGVRLHSPEDKRVARKQQLCNERLQANSPQGESRAEEAACG